MSYEVVLSQKLNERISQLDTEATVQGQGSRIRSALQTITGLLATDPLHAGELKYHLPTGAPVFQCSLKPLVATYVVYEAARVVWVTRVERLGGAGE
jgi:hypothetical protein